MFRLHQRGTAHHSHHGAAPYEHHDHHGAPHHDHYRGYEHDPYGDYQHTVNDGGGGHHEHHSGGHHNHDGGEQDSQLGERAEINNCYAAVERPVEVMSKQKPEGGKIVVAEVSLSSCPGGTFTAYDRQGNKYSPLSVPWKETASSGGQGSWPLTGFLVFGMPSDASVLGIVWDWPIFEYVNVLIWE